MNERARDREGFTSTHTPTRTDSLTKEGREGKKEEHTLCCAIEGVPEESVTQLGDSPLCCNSAREFAGMRRNKEIF